MTRIQEGLCLAIVLLSIAVLAIFDVIPEQVAQYAPLVMAVWIIRGNNACAFRKA